MPEPPPSQLRRLLKEHPHDAPRITQAVASLLGVGLLALGVFGFLVVWHLIRRGRLIREGLSPPRRVRLPTMEPPRSGTTSASPTAEPEPEPGAEPEAVEERESGPI